MSVTHYCTHQRSTTQMVLSAGRPEISSLSGSIGLSHRALLLILGIYLGVAGVGTCCAAPTTASISRSAYASDPSRDNSSPNDVVLPHEVVSLSHGLFQNVIVYRPRGTPSSFVIFLSGEKGWRLGVVDMARRLARSGAIVAGVDTPQFIKALSANSARCEYPEGDLDSLSHFVQAYYRLPTYMRPLLAGYSSGASLAYASLAQSKPGVFAGLLALGFRPQLRMNPPLCQDNALKLSDRSIGPMLVFSPTSIMPAPLEFLEGGQDTIFRAGRTGDFILQIMGAHLISLPGVGHGYTRPASWVPQFKRAFDKLQRVARAETLPLPPQALRDLPIFEIPLRSANNARNTFAILMSGDGGWSGFEQGLANTLRAQGVAVVAMDTLRYFWTPRTPAGMAADLDRIIRYYLHHWNKKAVLLLGYSQGADVLPFALNRLPAETRLRVLLSGQVGLGERAVFAFHLHQRSADDDPATLAVLPEMQQIRSSPTLCIYGSGEADSLCPQLNSKRIQLIRLKGGHDAGGDPQPIVKAVLTAAGNGL